MVYAQHFNQEEFRDWAEDMSPRLVTMLDVLRFRLGRELGRGKMSEHNIDEWGKIGATLSPLTVRSSPPTIA